MCTVLIDRKKVTGLAFAYEELSKAKAHLAADVLCVFETHGQFGRTAFVHRFQRVSSKVIVLVNVRDGAHQRAQDDFRVIPEEVEL